MEGLHSGVGMGLRWWRRYVFFLIVGDMEGLFHSICWLMKERRLAFAPTLHASGSLSIAGTLQTTFREQNGRTAITTVPEMRAGGRKNNQLRKLWRRHAVCWIPVNYVSCSNLISETFSPLPFPSALSTPSLLHRRCRHCQHPSLVSAELML